MKKTALWVLGVLILLPILFLVAGAIAINTVDEKTLLNKLSNEVKTKLGRDLQFNGQAELKWFPVVGVDLSDVVLSEYQDETTFLQANQIDISLALLPLLSSSVVVDAVTVDGLNITVIKDDKGEFNFSKGLNVENAQETIDPTDDKQNSGQAFDFSIDSVRLANVDVTYIDKTSDLKATVEDFNLTTGKIAQNTTTSLQLTGRFQANQPQADLLLDLSSDLEFALGENFYTNLEGLNLTVKGTLNQQLLEAEVTTQLVELGMEQAKSSAPIQIKLNMGKNSAQEISTQLTLDSLSGSIKDVLKGNLTLVADFKQAGSAIDLSLKSPMTIDVNAQRVELSKLQGEVNADAEQLAQPLNVPVTRGSISVDGKNQVANVDLKTVLQSNKLNIDSTVKNFSSPDIVANIDAGAINLDQLLATAEDSGKAKGDANTQTEVDQIPVDLSPLKGIQANVTAAVASLTVSGLELQNIDIQAKLKNGSLELLPLSANLYGGTASGSVRANANTNQIMIRQNLTKVQIQPILKNLAGKDMLIGRGDVFIDLKTQGKIVNALKKNLNGRVSIALNDGAVKGFNLAQKLRGAKNLLSGQAQDTTTATDTTEQTDFTSMSVSFDVKNGVATSNDLTLMAPLFRIGGQGQVNLVENSLDYTADAAIVATSTGQGGKSFDEGLKGLNVPVRLYGDFADVQWKLLLQDMAKAAVKAKAKQKVEAKKEELKAKVDEKKEELKGDIENKLKDGLQNFF